MFSSFNKTVILLFLILSSCSNEISETTTVESDEIATFEGPTLPKIRINTQGKSIVDEPKIPARFEILEDDIVIEEHQIGIEIRGSSSQMFDKKSYGFETWNTNGEDLNVELAGFPKEEDWILYGPYSDKSLLRNVIIYELSNKMGQYASRTAFYDLEINDIFLGTYVLMEKIKRDKNRVDISKNKEEDISGGYILKIDKPTGDGGWYNENIAFGSQYSTEGIAIEAPKISFLYEYPDSDDINTEQKLYLQDYIHSFETALTSEDFTNDELGYRQFIDVDSFIDFFILNEISKNPDGFRLSTYLHKDKGEKLKMGPIWDFNIAFGNVDYCEGNLSSGWAHHFNSVCPNDTWLVPFWWNRFLEDPQFVVELKERWNFLRTDILATQTILSRIDELKSELEDKDSVNRNFGKWLVLGKYVWPNAFVGNSYSSEINYLEDWINERLSWMDSAINTL